MWLYKSFHHQATACWDEELFQHYVCVALVTVSMVAHICCQLDVRAVVSSVRVNFGFNYFGHKDTLLLSNDPSFHPVTVIVCLSEISPCTCQNCQTHDRHVSAMISGSQKSNHVNSPWLWLLFWGHGGTKLTDTAKYYQLAVESPLTVFAGTVNLVRNWS